MAVEAKYKIYNGTEWVEYTFTPSSHTHSEYAKKQYGVYLVIGNTTGTAGTWTGTNSDIIEYYDGLVINYKIGIAGASTTKLNINGLGAKTCYLRGTTKLTTHYEVGTMVLLAYNATTDAFYSTDYDTNTYTTRQYTTTTDADYPMLFAYETSLPSSYDTKYTRKNSAITANPSTGTVSATIFKEDGVILSSKYATISSLESTLQEAINYTDALNEHVASTYALIAHTHSEYATKRQGMYYIEGTGTTAGTWLGEHSDITEYYEGLMIAYKLNVAGASTTTLNINGLGAVTVVRNVTTAISTSYSVQSVVLLVYTVDTSGTAYWKVADYDTNSYTYTMSQYYTLTTSTSAYPIIYSYTTATGTSGSKTTYGAVKSGFTFTPASNLLTVPNVKLSGLQAPTTSGGSTYGVGSSGQVLMSNGTTCYWGDAPSGSGSLYQHNVCIMGLTGLYTSISVYFKFYSSSSTAISTFEEVVSKMNVYEICPHTSSSGNGYVIFSNSSSLDAVVMVVGTSTPLYSGTVTTFAYVSDTVTAI